MRGTFVLGWALWVAIGCQYDATGLGTSAAAASADTSTSTGTGTIATAGASTTGASTSASVDTGVTTTSEPPPGSTSSESSTGPTGTTGPDVPPLHDDGLLARWYLDEDVSGQRPRVAIDHEPPGLDLPLVYVDDAPAYNVLDGSRGLQWTDVGLDGRAMVDIAGTKLDELVGATRVTVELVAVVNDAMPETSRIFHVGTGNQPGDFVIGCEPNPRRLVLRWNGNTMRFFAADLSGARNVIHVVVEADQGDPLDRLRAYVNGEELEPTSDGKLTQPPQYQGLPLQLTSALVLGSRTDGQRSFRGRLHYAAIYTEVLTNEQIASNVAALLVSDDAR